jgi:hypothetical protein
VTTRLVIPLPNPALPPLSGELSRLYRALELYQSGRRLG